MISINVKRSKVMVTSLLQDHKKKLTIHTQRICKVNLLAGFKITLTPHKSKK